MTTHSTCSHLTIGKLIYLLGRQCISSLLYGCKRCKMKYVKEHLALKSTVVSIFTNCFNTEKLCVCALHMILPVNISDSPQ